MVRTVEAELSSSTGSHPAAVNARWTAFGDPMKTRFVRSEGLFDIWVAVR